MHDASALDFTLGVYMRHLVLGSEGVIGRHLCDTIENNGDKAIRWDIKLTDKHDIRNLDNYSDLDYQIRSSDYVHFLAYDVGGSKYLANKQSQFEYIQNNIDIMTNVFAALKQSENTPFTFASSQMSNMYQSTYGQLKAVGESYTKALNGVIVQFWNVFGYEPDDEKSHVICDFIRMALRDRRILCATNGHEFRHFSHATDIAKILYAVSKNPETPKGIPIPAVRGQKVSIEFLARHIGSVLNVPVYFGTKTDTVQGEYNNPYDLMQKHKYPFHRSEWYIDANMGDEHLEEYVNLLIQEIKEKEFTQEAGN